MSPKWHNVPAISGPTRSPVLEAGKPPRIAAAFLFSCPNWGLRSHEAVKDPAPGRFGGRDHHHGIRTSSGVSMVTGPALEAPVATNEPTKGHWINFKDFAQIPRQLSCR